MITWKCPNCKRVRETEDNIVCLQCVCGEYFEKLNKNIVIEVIA